MDTIALIARHGEAVRHAIALGDIVHMDTASEEITDEFLLFAINSGLLNGWARGFPDPRQEAEIGMEVILAASVAARFAGLYSFRKLGYVLQSARVLGALGSRVAVTEAGQGMRGVAWAMCRSSVAMCCGSCWYRWKDVSRSAKRPWQPKTVSIRGWGAYASGAHGGAPKAKWMCATLTCAGTTSAGA